jgi:hypothetical protein
MRCITNRLKVAGYVTLLGVALTSTARAEKIVVANYHAQEQAETVFDEIVKTVTLEKYILRLADKSQGTIQVDKMAWGSGTEYASVFINVHRSGDKTFIQATFARHAGIVGGGSPRKWATVFQMDLSRALPDLTADDTSTVGHPASLH